MCYYVISNGLDCATQNKTETENLSGVIHTHLPIFEQSLIKRFPSPG